MLGNATYVLSLFFIVLILLHTPEKVEILRHIRLVAMDVDGTLTDGSLYYSHQGEEMKRFHVRDGMGIVLLHQAGLQTALLTSDASEIIATRAARLNIPNVLKGIHNKAQALQELCMKLRLTLDKVAYIGDDINDVDAMKLCGFSACPADAVQAIKEIAHAISQYNGGHGAVREIIEHILLAQGRSLLLLQ